MATVPPASGNHSMASVSVDFSILGSLQKLNNIGPDCYERLLSLSMSLSFYGRHAHSRYYFFFFKSHCRFIKQKSACYGGARINERTSSDNSVPHLEVYRVFSFRDHEAQEKRST